jgi:hypothetical protein
VQLELGHLDDAQAAIRRALARVYGPRKLRLLDLAATIAEKRHDAAAARRALDEAIALAEKLPPGQHGAQRAAALRKRRDAIR